MAASELRAGEPLGRVDGRRQPLRAAEIGLLAAAGVRRVPVVRRPRTRILIGGVADALGPMLEALVARDGGTVTSVDRLDRRQASAADLARGADVVLIAGNVADGPETEIQGVAIEPGRETCLGRVNSTIIALLPGLPAACFWAYELVAGRAVRCRGGRDPGLPYASRRLHTRRKIVSTLGVTEVVPVRLDSEDAAAVLPLPGGRSPRLRTAAEADGFTLVPATSEGFAAGSMVTVWLFEPGAVRGADGG
jgi:molybdopterin biosynthesis enzyme